MTRATVLVLYRIDPGLVGGRATNSGMIDCGPGADVSWDAGTQALTLKGPEVDLTIDAVDRFTVEVQHP